MYDRKRKAHVTFDAMVLPVSRNPNTFEEHLEFAVWYQMISSPRRTSGSGGSNREKVLAGIRSELAKCSLMQLRAIFLFAVFERAHENTKGDTLNVLERAQLWEAMAHQRLITYCASRLPAATDATDKFTYDF
jgi:hypothetical protein